jgi:hypothetical protein
MPVIRIAQTPAPPSLPLDPNFVFGEVAPIIAFVVVVVVGGLVLRWLFRTPIGEAVAEGIRERRRRRWGEVPEVGAAVERVTALEDDIRRLRGELSELAERLDFAERMLAVRRERTLGAGQ